MVTTADNDIFTKTQVNQEFDEDDYSDDSDSMNETEVADQGQEQNQYFHVTDAEPPTNYDDPYSTLPQKVEFRLDSIMVTDPLRNPSVARCDFVNRFREEARGRQHYSRPTEAG